VGDLIINDYQEYFFLFMYIILILHISFLIFFKYYTIKNFFHYLKQPGHDINKIALENFVKFIEFVLKFF